MEMNVKIGGRSPGCCHVNGSSLVGAKEGRLPVGDLLPSSSSIGGRTLG